MAVYWTQSRTLDGAELARCPTGAGVEVSEVKPTPSRSQSAAGKSDEIDTGAAPRQYWEYPSTRCRSRAAMARVKS